MLLLTYWKCMTTPYLIHKNFVNINIINDKKVAKRVCLLNILKFNFSSLFICSTCTYSKSHYWRLQGAVAQRCARSFLSRYTVTSFANILFVSLEQMVIKTCQCNMTHTEASCSTGKYINESTNTFLDFLNKNAAK